MPHVRPGNVTYVGPDVTSGVHAGDLYWEVADRTEDREDEQSVIS